jgi:hypothetical protein
LTESNHSFKKLIMETIFLGWLLSTRCQWSQTVHGREDWRIAEAVDAVISRVRSREPRPPPLTTRHPKNVDRSKIEITHFFARPLALSNSNRPMAFLRKTLAM